MTKLGIINLFVLVSMLLFLSSCEVVKGIFEAGVWVGIVAVVLVVLLFIFILKKIF